MPELGYKPVNRYLPPRPQNRPVMRRRPVEERLDAAELPSACCAGSTKH